MILSSGFEMGFGRFADWKWWPDLQVGQGWGVGWRLGGFVGGSGLMSRPGMWICCGTPKEVTKSHVTTVRTPAAITSCVNLEPSDGADRSGMVGRLIN